MFRSAIDENVVGKEFVQPSLVQIHVEVFGQCQSKQSRSSKAKDRASRAERGGIRDGSLLLLNLKEAVYRRFGLRDWRMFTVADSEALQNLTDGKGLETEYGNSSLTQSSGAERYLRQLRSCKEAKKRE